MESIIPTATLLRPPPSHFLQYIDRDEHSYCTYFPFSSLDTPQRSLETNGHCHQEEGHCIDKHSLFTVTNKDGSPSLPSSVINRFPTSNTPSPVHHRHRSLTDAATTSYNEMTAFITEAPGSPPGLTGSKSSKSSSFHSSSYSGAEGILSDSTHFEEIGLEEDHHHPQYQNLYGMEKPLRPLPRPATTGGISGSSPALTTRRELTNASNKPLVSRLQPPMKGHNLAQSLSLSNGKSLPTRRGLRSPSTPSLAITAMSNRNRSRSPSPNTLSPSARPLPSPVSPKRPDLCPSPRMKNLPVRRGSWQPSRKSIKEIEAEYDDLDEDLPEDASLWNVPLSPRPPTERTPISPSVSPKASPRTSPERPISHRASVGTSTIKAPLTAPSLSASSPLSHSLDSPPSSPRKIRPPVRGASTGGMPDNFAFPGGRTKSWNIALSELSEDAKSLTEALENHAGFSEQKHEEAVQNGDAAVRPSMEKLSRAKTSTVELPPLRLNNVMIDPLPISKEKEKVLSRTRPSWLPPKSQKEERRHLKEYQRMMEFSLEAGMDSDPFFAGFLANVVGCRTTKGR